MFNTVLNELFRLKSMREDKPKRRRSIDQALERAKIRGWNQTKFASKLDSVVPQDITNWKARGMPTDKLEEVADVLNCSVDWLLDRNSAASPDSLSRSSKPSVEWPFESNVPFADYDALETEQKEDIAETIEDKIRRFKEKNNRRRRSAANEGTPKAGNRSAKRNSLTKNNGDLEEIKRRTG